MRPSSHFGDAPDSPLVGWFLRRASLLIMSDRDLPSAIVSVGDKDRAHWIRRRMSNSLHNETTCVALPEVAFYYPNPIWRYGDWIKNLILFFDGVALLVPNYMTEKPEQIDAAIVNGLREHGLLHILEPETAVDQSAAEKLASVMADLFSSGLLDALGTESTAFHELSYSRLGGSGDQGLANMILEELKSRGLARDSEEGVSIPMHPTVRSLVLVLLAQILKPKGRELGLDLSPATDRPEIVKALADLLSLPNQPSAGEVVASDLLTVGVNLSAIPIDEILDYRRQNQEAYRAYRRSLRSFIRNLQGLDRHARDEALAERQTEIEDLANDVRRASRLAWRRPASLTLGLVGAAWAVSGDPLGAVLSAAGAVTGFLPDAKFVSAYSYFFSAPGHQRWL